MIPEELIKEIDIEYEKLAIKEHEAYLRSIRINAYIAGLCGRCGEYDSLGHQCQWPPKLLKVSIG